MAEPTSTFIDRFAVFYDSCSPDEREALAMLGTAAGLVRDGAIDEHEVSGFQAGLLSLQAQLERSPLVDQLLSTLSDAPGRPSRSITQDVRP